MLHLGSGVYYGLNSVCTRVWKLIQSPTRGSTIRTIVLDEYDVDPVVCERELVALLNELSARGLISITRDSS